MTSTNTVKGLGLHHVEESSSDEGIAAFHVSHHEFETTTQNTAEVLRNIDVRADFPHTSWSCDFNTIISVAGDQLRWQPSLCDIVKP